MQAVGFYLLLPFIYFVSVLPFPLLYVFSDLLYFGLYKLIGYRVKVVRRNLLLSFPEKTAGELRDIEKKFYTHLCDLMVETLKALTISEDEVRKRMKFRSGSMDVFDRLYKEGRPVVALMGHVGCWEWAGLSMSLQSRYHLRVIYRPLKQQQFDQLFIKLRSRFGAQALAMDNVVKEMLGDKSRLACTVFIADQTPLPDGANWIKFLNQDTPFFQGAEKLSMRLKLPVVFAAVHFQRRGFYEIEITEITDDASKLNAGELTSAFARRLEDDIRAIPHQWLWSHRRWKHQRKV
jgi:KDO2-lipid IV(A) lauroyltransferase